MNKVQITNHQLFAIVANYSIGTVVISTSASLAGIAKQDAWIAALITPILGLPFIWMYYRLGELYPDKTLVDILKSSFGKWIGNIISVFLILFVFLMSATHVVAYVGDFVQTEYMTETPLYALNVVMVIGMAMGILYGLESIARSSEIFIYVVTVSILLAMLLNLPNIKPENLLPVLEEGMVPVFKGSLFLSSYMTWGVLALNMIYPINISPSPKTKKAMFMGYLLGGTINFICTLMAILVLGSTITSRSNYPTYLLVKEIEIGIITRIEGIVSGAWIITEFVKALLYLYAVVIGLSQIIRLKDHRKIVLPLCLVTVVLSGIVYPNSAYYFKWDSETWVLLAMSFGGVMPVIILIITSLKKIKKKLKAIKN